MTDLELKLLSYAKLSAPGVICTSYHHPKSCQCPYCEGASIALELADVIELPEWVRTNHIAREGGR